jgi:hypothetical protein
MNFLGIEQILNDESSSGMAALLGASVEIRRLSLRDRVRDPAVKKM